jgi:hypothetical protein
LEDFNGDSGPAATGQVIACAKPALGNRGFKARFTGYLSKSGLVGKQAWRARDAFRE